ncbi:MAG: hypothetical protein E7172_04930 [Firmicutes bacterium]|nr:hypothetical protein [Bacillota bacterium]
MKLTLEDEKIIRHLGYPKKIKLSSGEYYVKMLDEKYVINELIGYQMAQKIGLECAKYLVILLDDNYYCLSLDLGQEGVFKTAKELGILQYSLYYIWHKLSLSYECVPTLMYDIVKMYIFDLFMLNADRNSSNWGIRDINNVQKVCILDHEFIMESDESHCLTADFYKKEDKDVLKYRSEEIILFLKDSSQEFIELFLKIYSLLNVDFLESVLEDIEKMVPIKEKNSIIDLYQKNYNLITQILKDHGLLQSR